MKDSESHMDEYEESRSTEIQLLAQLAESKAENRALRRELLWYRYVVSLTTSVANYATMGPGLTHALERWEKAFFTGRGPWRRRVPRKETLEVVAAYLRRRAMSGVAIALLAAIPSALTLLLLWQQNKKIDLQIFLASSAQARDSQDEVASLLSSIDEYLFNSCLEIPSEFRNGKKLSSPEAKSGDEETTWDVSFNRCWEKQRSANPISRYEWLALSEKFTGAKREFTLESIFMNRESGVAYRSDLLRPDALSGLSLPLSRDLGQQVANLANSLRSYRIMLDKPGEDQSPQLTRNIYSPEKGRLLQALGSRILSISNFNAAHIWAPMAHLSDLKWEATSLADAMMECANFTAGNFVNSDLSRGRFVLAKFDYADLTGISGWTGADFTNASFRGALMPDAEKLAHANFSGADFDQAIVAEKGWYEKVLKLSPTKKQVRDGEMERIIKYDYFAVKEAWHPEDYRPSAPKRPITLWKMVRFEDPVYSEKMRDAECIRRVGENFKIS